MKVFIRFIITLSLFGFIFWARILKERTSLNLIVLTFNDNKILLLTSIILIILNLVLLFRIITSNLLKNSQNSLLKKFLNISCIKIFIDGINFIYTAPKILYEEYSDKYNLFNDQIEMSASYIVTYFNYQKTLLIVFFYIPRLIVASIFIVDIFVFEKFYYFYISLILLVIPLLSRIYLYMILYQSKLMIEYSEFFLDITKMPHGMEIKLKTTPVRNKSLEWMSKKWIFLRNSWFIGKKLNNFVSSIYVQDALINSYITFYTSLFYITGWSYICYLIIS